ncbi:uncharacterized protein LOC130440035 isoform X2 [Triplophysa dalaica]|nr:uncharacterized protein LOC130440035 isoform X2 [Triplophysa dalaica]
MLVEEPQSRAVNGSKETKRLTERDDGESPPKAQKLQQPNEAGDGNDRGDGDQTDVEMDENTDQNEDMNSDEKAEQDSWKSKSGIDDKHDADVQEENLQRNMVLRSRRSIHKTVDPDVETSNSTFRELKNFMKSLNARASPASSSRGRMWYVCKLLQWSLIPIVLLALSLYAYQSSLPKTNAVKQIIKRSSRWRYLPCSYVFQVSATCFGLGLRNILSVTCRQPIPLNQSA